MTFPAMSLNTSFNKSIVAVYRVVQSLTLINVYQPFFKQTSLTVTCPMISLYYELNFAILELFSFCELNKVQRADSILKDKRRPVSSPRC